MKYDINEYINIILMQKKSIILVEGQDDIEFYNRIALDCNKDLDVIPIELIDGYSEGCEQILKCIESIQEIIKENPIIEEYLLGIIDRDMRYIRGERPSLDCLFMLKYYSYESHFINFNTIKRTLEKITRINEKNIDRKVQIFLEDGLEDKLDKLFIVSLEACKNSLEKEYEGKVGFSVKAGSIYSYWIDKGYQQFNLEELNDFAKEHELKIEDIKNVAKGKWLLRLYCEHTLSKIKKLSEVCNEVIKPCIYCASGKPSKCLWKLKVDLQIDAYENRILESYDKDEVDYIIERISQLK